MADLSRFPTRTTPRRSQPARPTLEDIEIRISGEEARANLIDDAVDAPSARRALTLSSELGYPSNGVAADVGAFEQEAQDRRTSETIFQSPPLAGWLKDPLRASASKDDIPSLGAIAKIFNGDDTMSPAMRRLRTGTAMPYALQATAFNGRVGTPAPQAPRTGQRATAGNVAKGLVAGFVGSVADVGLMALGNAADEFGKRDELLASDYYQGRRAEREELRDIADVRYDPLGQVAGIDVNPGQWAYSAATSGLQMLGVSGLGKKALLGLATLSGAESQQRLQERGAGLLESTAVGVATGAIEYVTEKASLDFLFKNFGKKGVTSLLKGFLLRELPGELAATTGQGLVDALATGGQGFESYVANLPQDLADTAGTVAALGIGIGGLNVAARRLSRESKANDDAEHAQVGAAVIDHLMEQAEKSKLKGEAPETFREYVSHVIDSSGAPVRDLYIPVEAILELQQTEGYEPETLAPYADQIAAAAAIPGSDVVIPIADAAAFLGGTATWEALKDSARVQPGGVSLKEAREENAERDRILEQRGAEIAAEVAADKEQRSAAAEVYTDVKNRLLAGGIQSTEAESVAQVVAARYETRAAARGQTPMQAWQEAKVSFGWEGRTVAEGDREVAQEEPLAGMPQNIKVDGQLRRFGPYRVGRQAAAKIAKRLGITHSPPKTYARVDPARAARIAQEFELMEHNPSDPEVQAAYKAMIDETVEQYKELMKTGLKVEFITGADPYGNPRNAILDVVENNHLWVYPTDAGFGGPSSTLDVSDNPLLAVVPGIKISGREVRANDIFRVVHDFFGHIMEGVGFRADGEENAWRIHSAMYSPLARRAMTTETRGQNSWVNFGPFGEKNRTASGAETEYAPQKIGLLPEWVSEEGLEDRTFEQAATNGGYEGLAAYLTDEEKAKLREDSKAKIMAIAESLPDAEEMAAVALAGRAKKGWYENSAQAILDVFGAADAPRFAALLAALSPQTSVESNLYNALKTWANWNDAGRPTDRKAIVEVMGKSVQGGKGVGSILNAWINNSVTALQSTNPAAIVLSGPKVDSFMNNLVGVVDEVTNDAWMANYAAVDQVLFKKTGSNKGPGYKAMNAVVRAAADILSKKTGELWTPAEVQETVWSLAKTLYEKRDSKGEKRTMRALLEAGGVTHDDIANTPDFAVLFADGVYKTILEEAGYGQQTQSLGRNRRAVGVDGSQSVDALPEASGFDEAAYRQFLGQAADRLESVRAARRGEPDQAQRELFQQDMFNSIPDGPAVDPVGRRTAFHGTLDDFDTFRSVGQAVWFSEGRELAETYADPRRMRRLGPGRVIEAEVNVQRPLYVDDALRTLPSHGVVENPVAWVKEQFGFDLKAHGWERIGQDYSHAITRSAAFADAARAAGYDAIGMMEGGSRTWGMLRPGSITSSEDGRTLFQDQPVFYSALARAVADSKTTKAPAAQWLATLRKAPGVRQEELEWSGLLELLEMTQGPVTRDELLTLLREGGVTVDEVVLGDIAPLREQGIQRIMEDLPGTSRAEAAEMWDDDPAQQFEVSEAGREPQFKSWSSDSSNDTYRELLITLPVGVGRNPARAPSTHWDQEGVIAHARFMDKTDADGKRVLFIEEVQSDWHQKGRDEGYETEVDPAIAEAATKEHQDRLAEFRAAETEMEIAIAPLLPLGVLPPNPGARILATAYRKVLDGLFVDPTVGTEGMGEASLEQREALTEAYRAMTQAELRATEARNAMSAAISPKGIPEAPFKTTWPALVMKRMIRYAAENGYDRVAWTTGKEQSERYNLSQAVGDIDARRQSNGSYLVTMGNGTAANTLAENGMGERHNGTSRLIMTPEQLKAAFGGDIAAKIEAGETNLDGSDLNVGGEGMRAFYDRNLVNITNDIIKKHGAKVGAVAIPMPNIRNFELNLESAQKAYDDELAMYKFENSITRKTRDRLADAKAAYEAARTAAHPGFDLTDKMREVALAGQPLFQNKAKPRGSVTFLADGAKLISLFETANRSTLLHEFSHVWLEEVREDALREGASKQAKDDWKAFKRWAKSLGIIVSDTAPIPTQAHEYWARGGERYFMEGKAPRADLAGSFKRFAAWMARIYQVVTNLNAPINPEIREVFDRLLATQDAIDAYREQQKVEPLFKSAEDAGMTDDEFDAYQRSVTEARDEAFNVLLFKTMESIRRKRRADMRDKLAGMRADVAQEINSRPEFIALHLLRTGRWLGDPDRDRQDVKLNTGWLIDTFGEDILTKLPKGLPITRGDGLEGDEVAEMVGAESGQALVHALVGMRTMSEALRASGETRSLRDKLISEEVERRAAEEFGDPFADGSIEEEAIAALNTAKQGEIIAGEIRQLGKRSSITSPQTPYQFAREWAKRTIFGGYVRDVASRAAVQRYIRATAKASRAAEKAILEGDIDEAYRQKQAQLLNHALLAESKKAADEVDTIVARLQKYAKRAAMKSVDQDYMDKVHMLLENYDLRERSLRSIDEQAGFQKWAEGQRAKGFEVHIPPRLENRGVSYQKVTVEELMSLNDLVASLIHLGKTKKKIMVAQAERDFDELVDTAVATVEQLPQRKLPPTPVNEEARALASGAAELLKVETIVEELDGGPTGPFNDVLIVGAATAENKRNALRDKVMRPIAEAYRKLSRRQWKRYQEKVTIPELTWNTLNEGDPRVGQPVTMTRLELLSMVLNTGNLSNLEKLSKGERWPVATIRAVADRELTKEDWDFVQLLWTQVNTLWPDIVAVERELSGVVPEQVVSTPIETRFGTYEGGYWPVVYDAARWQRAEDLEGARADDMFGIKSGVATQKGHTITRTEAFGPISFNLENVLFQHLEQVVTRIAFSAFARDMLRFTRNERVRGIIDTRLGSEYRKQFEPWLARQVQEGQTDTRAARWWGKLLKQARINMTIAAMGFRFSTGVAQAVGLTASAHRIGAVNVGRGLKRLVANPRKGAQFVFDRSPEMVSRNEAVNREVAEVFSKMRGKHSMLTEAQAWAFWHIGMIDRYLVSIPTWLGAHEQGMKQGMTDKQASDYADKSVRMSQGAGGAKDLSRIQGDQHPAMRFFTLFYTPFNVMFNAQWQGVRGLKKSQLAPMIGVTFWWMIASTLADALLSGDAPDWDDEEAVLGWFSRNVFFGMFAGVPLVRDIAGATERKSIGEYADAGATPVTRVYDSIDKVYKMGDKYVTEGESPTRPIKQIADLTALLTGTPVSQAGTTGQFLWDYQAGEADPQSISDWYFGITRGKVPEEKAE